jgi:hypothetical protein
MLPANESGWQRGVCLLELMSIAAHVFLRQGTGKGLLLLQEPPHCQGPVEDKPLEDKPL